MTPPPIPPVIETRRQQYGFPLWLALALVAVGALIFLGALWIEISATVGSPAQRASDSTASVLHVVYILSGGAFVIGSIATLIHLFTIIVRRICQRALRKNE
jgi:uncharacterized membrane protein YhaH (DUF805 family)